MSRLALPLATLLLWVPMATHGSARDDIPAPPVTAEPPFLVEHTWWLKPGRSGQFISLFKKTRLPALQAELAAGRLLGIRMTQPQLHGNRDQWDFRLTLSWRDRASALHFVQTQKPTENQRQSMEEQLRDEMVLDHSEVLLLEESL